MKINQTCPECGRTFPLHSNDCYHSDCDEDDMAVHGCGVGVGMCVLVDDPKHDDSPHMHMFAGNLVDLCFEPGCNGGTVVDGDDEAFWIEFDEMLEIDPE